MPHCELQYSDDLQIDARAILAEVEAIILAHDPDANIVMVSSVVNAQLIQKLLSLGALDAIKKPINEDKLKKTIDNLD